MYIRGRGKIGYLTRDVKAPEIFDPSYGVWDAENSMIMAWLVNSMDEDIGANYMCYSTAKELWDNVSQMYSDYGNQSQIYELQLALGDIRQGDYSITKYFNTLKRLWQDLDLFNDYEWENMEDFKHHKQTVNNERIFKFLSGLNVEFDEVKGRIIGRKPLPTLEDVFSKVRREESRRDANATRSITQQQQKPRVWCDYCNKPRHTWEACWKLHEKPADWKNSKHSRASTNEVENLEKNLSKEQIDHVIKLLTSNPPPSTPSGSLAQTGSIINALFSHSPTAPWIIDSGASDHMTSISSLFDSYYPCPGNKKDRDLGMMIGSASLREGLYYFDDYLSRNKQAQACYLINRMPTRVLKYQSPLEYFTLIYPSSRVTSNIQLRVFGCSVFVHVPNHLRSKLDPRSEKCVFLGYAPNKKGYKCFNPQTKKFHVSMDVIILENQPFFGQNSLQGEKENSEDHFWHTSTPVPNLFLHDLGTSTQTQKTDISTNENLGNLELQEPSVNVPETGGEILQDKIPPPELRVYTRKYHHSSKDPLINSIPIPKTIKEALDHPDWKLAVLEEMNALKKNGTWEIVDLPKEKKTVGCKWVFTLKCNADGSVERYKARLVAKGFTQTYGIDYQETFAPVAKINSIRVLISLAVHSDWNLYQLDVKNTFLNGELEEEVFMDLPPGFEGNHGSSKVCKLHKSLYGLKQSPRAWFECFGKLAVLIVYVDDIILTGDDLVEICRLKKVLARDFEIKDLGNLKYFLGMEFARSKDGIVVSQRKYVLDLLEETGLLSCKAAETPIDPNMKLQPAKIEDVTNIDRYQCLVGRLIYLSHTRPNIAFAVSLVSQFMHAPGPEHFETVYRILRYLKGSPGKGLLLRKNGHLQVEVYTDADWAGSVTDRRSTSGYCTFVGGNLVTWRSKKQTVVARSSAEAEYRAVALGICEVFWIKKILEELKASNSLPMKVYCDNKSAIAIAHNPVLHNRTKHVEVDKHFIKEKLDSGLFCMPYIPTNEQIADILTKGLPKKHFEKLVCKLAMKDIFRPA
ncbi:retrovirus-related pol polyprotein from transposon RE1 [Citrus sinensis]|uniref:Retrovirus-related pol polyprotein from transposon RE1 n=1 Tax=Citrus sinensis TaxID=2711 RepID=A0ACB8INK8_CITSI|nr:retrovirus-related pol polyprotein from transposon RE1 [Citrus sinensis]